MMASELDPAEHPEEALDRAVAGDLPASEQRALDLHLATCGACVAHLRLARAGREARGAQPWDPPLNRRAVEGALASFERRGWAARISLPALRRRWAVLVAAILLGLGSVASATWWRLRRPVDDAARPVPAVVPQRARALTPARTAPAPSEDAPPAAADLSDDPATVHRAGRTTPSAAALFEEASVLRDQNRPDQALAVFHRLQQLHPGARETRISFALAGRLLLDRGRPAQALAQFDQHLARGGEAAEEALAGRATALSRMGRPAAERDAWRRLLAAYPRTVYAIQAQARLSALEAAPGAPAGTGGGVQRDRTEARP